MARLETSAESPVPVRVVAMKLAEWIGRLGEVWIEGQIAQLDRRPGGVDPVPDPARPGRRHLAAPSPARAAMLPDALAEGSRVVVCAPGRTSGSSAARSACARREIRARSGSVSCWPGSSSCSSCWPPRACSPPSASGRCRSCRTTIGLITGRASAAERDVVENARRRWPGGRFRDRERRRRRARPRCTRSSPRCSASTRDPDVDVIVHRPRRRQRRGPAAVLQRVAGAGRVRRAHPGRQRDRPRAPTPRCSTSSPTSRASTPTDAAKRIVPDLAAGTGAVAELRRRARATVHRRLDREAELMAGLPERLRGDRPRPPRPAARRGPAGPRPVARAVGRLLDAGAPTSSTSAPGSARCRRRPRSTAATRSSGGPTAPSSARPPSAARCPAHPGRGRRVRRRRDVVSPP